VTDRSADVLQGTLDLLILKVVARAPMHGWGISQSIQARSQEVLQVTQGSLYPALHRLEQKGWLASEWGTSENNRRAKFYRLTAAGRRALAQETESWRRYTGAVDAILGT
jgi:PadR family transcriptional regulator, regulatory protein PadR